LSIKRDGATANSLIIERARPAEVPEPLITSFLQKPAATEVRCGGIELSPCSAACPSGTIYTSFQPDICAGLLSSGTSAAPLLVVGLPFEFVFADQTMQLPGYSRGHGSGVGENACVTWRDNPSALQVASKPGYNCPEAKKLRYPPKLAGFIHPGWSPGHETTSSKYLSDVLVIENGP
ncbi:hypothetical protein THAOC_01763, partial [Thalassiosira oceanica]